MKSFFLKLLMKEFFDFLWKKVEGLYKEWVADKAVKKKNDENASAAVDELRKPLDPSKSVEEREKDEEAKFDKFRDSLK